MKATKTEFKRTDIGLIPEDWQVKELREILQESGYIRGPFGSSLRRPELKTEGIPVYEQEHAIHKRRSFRFFVDHEKFKKLSRFVVQKNDLIISCSGVTLGKVSIISDKDPKGIISQALLTLRPDTKKVNPRFLLFFFDSKQGYDSLASRSLGSAQPNLASRKIIEQIQIPVPPYEEQDAISKFISDLDSMIELNKLMNKTLEEIGKVIFKHWFIDFEFPNEEGKPYKSSGGKMIHNDQLPKEIPAGWEIGRFSKLIQLLMGLSPKGESYNVVGDGIPLINGAADFSEDVIIPNKFTTQPTRVCKTGDLLFCIRGTIGNLTYADKQYCLGRGVASITPINESYKEYAFFVLNHGLKEMISKAAGSVIVGLSKPDILDLKLVIPAEKIMSKFHLGLENIFEKRELIKNKTSNLSQIRDLLLPRLMSGKIRVPIEVR